MAKLLEKPFARWPDVSLCRRSGMKTVRLRIDPRRGGFLLSCPRRVSLRALEDFLSGQEAFMAGQRSEHRPVAVCGAGEEIPLRGHAVPVVWAGGLRGHASVVEGRLLVPGDRAACARRVRDFLKAEARRDILPLVAEKVAMAGVRVRGVSFRDPRARWGSCSPDGRLSFSFRLVMAPPEILDYVVAHEVAHLLHHDHGAAFWRACAGLLSAPGVAGCRAWLRANGAALQAVDFHGQNGIDGENGKA